ncbi:MAG: phosphoribosylglycinamide formyltransferase [Melioribacteraceae bacterium]|nr:phosphoribosylglycinamide formyltransferase [Melioribacteraceae bacterium]
MYKIAVFVSGRGSNLKSILDSFPQDENEVKVVCVVSDKIDCPAFETAHQNNIKTYSISNVNKEYYLVYSELISILDNLKVDLIVLAGYLKKIPDELIEQYEKRIINIHPALLPSFGGKGMYGSNVHKAVFEKSVQVSGATIHFVDKIYDNGKIIAQQSVNIGNVNTPKDIAERVLKIEHQLLPFVIKKFSMNKVVERNNRVYLLN